ncbi:hypothetical protein E1A05_12475 [Salmonella enterica subsp. enterica serovar Braenderup]|nr:hypothetical protein [Salmonella enterica subsp. enterica serovar Braenderup]
MTQDEFETMVKQYYKEGVILYIVEPGQEAWLNKATLSVAIRGEVTVEMRNMARLIHDTAITGGKLVSLAHFRTQGRDQVSLDAEVDVVATVGFDLDGLPGSNLVVIKKWRGYDAIPSPGVWPATN